MGFPVRLAPLAICACLLLGGCQDQEPIEVGPSPADEAKAGALLASYESARASQNWEAAEALADQLHEKFPTSAAAGKAASSLPAVRDGAMKARDAHRLQRLWQYQAVEVGKGEQLSATIFSRTVPAEDGEVAPTADAQLVLRDHPAWGRSAYLLLAQTQFSCGRPCAVQIGFDSRPARRYAGKQADSGKGPALFIEDDGGFITAMSQAKTVRIELPKGSGRIPALVFDVGGYAPARFAKP